MDLPNQAHRLPLYTSVFGIQYEAPGEFVTAGGSRVPPRSADECPLKMAASRCALAFQFAEDLLPAIIGPDRAANRARSSVIENERLSTETYGGS